MRVFTRIRQMLTDNTELRLEIAEIKQAVEKINKKQDGQDKNIELIYRPLAGESGVPRPRTEGDGIDRE